MPRENQNHDKTVHIKIDRSPFAVEADALTGAQLRALPSPPIGPDRDLYLEVPGPGDDLPIGDADPVQLRDGEHFFTTPSTINPGGHARR